MADKLVSCIRTLRIMLEERGLDVASVMNRLSESEILSLASSGTFVLFPCDSYAVVFFLQPKLSANLVRSEIKKFLTGSSPHFLIIVLKDIPTNLDPQISKIKSDCPSLSHVQVFTLDQLAFVVSQHILVPKHEKLSDHDANEVLSRYKLKNKFQLPIILSNDPMAKHLGLVAGDIVKITRTSPSAGEHIAYRCCVHSSN